jgi:hypothetical protein
VSDRFMEGMNPLPDAVAESNAKAPAGGRRYEVQLRAAVRHATGCCAGESAPFAPQDRQIGSELSCSSHRSG